MSEFDAFKSINSSTPATSVCGKWTGNFTY